MSATDPRPEKRKSRMPAGPTDPVIGVHVLTEFVFCPRAGLCSHEARGDDRGEEILDPSLDYMPRYELRRIEDALRRVKRHIAGLGLFGIVLAAVTAGLTLAMHRYFLWLGVLALTVLAKRLFREFRKALTLAWRRREAQRAEPVEPDATSDASQAVNWWSLLQAGFRSIPYKDNLFDEDWKLAGRPWRVLRRGSERIPVFRKRRGDPAIHRQHKVRMAAYCHLLARCEAAESPYGIVLFGDSYEGVTVPNSPGVRKLFHDELLAARLVVRQAQQKNLLPPPPENRSSCLRCPVGRPFVCRPPSPEHLLEPGTVPPFPANGQDRRQYHSTCGDRFCWVPPHEKALAKGLVAAQIALIRTTADAIGRATDRGQR